MIFGWEVASDIHGVGESLLMAMLKVRIFLIIMSQCYLRYPTRHGERESVFCV